MAFVSRDKDGKIITISLLQTDECLEKVDTDSDELRSALTKIVSNSELISSDLAMIRVIEDLIDVLISKSLISITDFPESVQLKLLSRKNFRKNGTFDTSTSDLIKI
jgi:hypothetical protein